MQVKMLIKGFQELGILEKGKSIQYNYLNPTAIGPTIWLPICCLDLVLNALVVPRGEGRTKPNMTLCVVSLFPGHSLGMDIHDSMTLPKDKPLEPGVVSC